MAATILCFAYAVMVLLVQRISCQSTPTDADTQQSPFGLSISAPSNERGGGALVDLKLPFLRVLAGGFGDRDPNNPNGIRRGGGGAEVSIGNLLRIIGFGDGTRGGGGGGGADVQFGSPNGNLKPEPVENISGAASDAELIISPRTNSGDSGSRSARGSVDPLGIGAAFQRFIAGSQN